MAQGVKLELSGELNLEHMHEESDQMGRGIMLDSSGSELI